MKIFLIFFSLFFVLPVSAQQPCNLTLKDSPVIRGLKLGMTKTEVEKVIPLDNKITYANFIDYSFNKGQISKIKAFQGLDTVYIRFIDQNKNLDNLPVEQLTFVYDNSVQWSSHWEFARFIADYFKLPFKSFVLDDNNRIKLNCIGFRLLLQPNYISLDTTQLEDKKNLENERRKKSFKP